jgi:GxxExxY protein
LLVTRQTPVPVFFEEVRMELGFRADLIVENKVIVELKSVDAIPSVHFKKLVTYLRFAKLTVALMINFNEVLLKNGIKRIVNNYVPQLK